VQRRKDGKKVTAVAYQLLVCKRNQCQSDMKAKRIMIMWRAVVYSKIYQ